MEKRIKILHLEDKRSDADLVKRELTKSGIEFELVWVNGKKSFEDALKSFSPDIILSDHSLPSFDSSHALRILREEKIDVPFILITATMSDEFAVGLMKEGIVDYILKDRIQRLPNAVLSAIEKFTAEKEKQRYLKELISNERRLSEAQRIAHIGSWELDFKTGIAVWSGEACRIYGIPPEESEHSFDEWFSFVHPEDKDFVKKEIDDSGKTFGDSSYRHRILRRDGTVKYIHSISKFEFDKEGRPIGLFGISHDITDVRMREEQKEFDANNLKALINNTKDLMWSVDKKFNLITSNEPFDEMSLVSFGRVIEKGTDVLDVAYSDEMRAHFKQFYERAFAGEAFTEIEHFEYPVDLWTEISYYPIRKGEEVIGTACHSRDITHIKMAQEKILNSEIQIRNFAKHLNHAQEEERARIAREIHDELGQQLVGIKIGLSSFIKNMGSKEEATETINEMKNTVDSSIQSLRKIATELRPGILDTLGLVPSIEWLAKEFERKTGCKCKVEIAVKEQVFAKEISICFFRICQEALTNIIKHAGASMVTIVVSEEKDQLILKIADNGSGISSDKLENPFSMGLLGMNERATSINGKLRISRGGQNGTIIELKAPKN